MSHPHHSPSRARVELGGWRAAAIVVALACVGASIVQASSYLGRLGGTTEMRILFCGIATALLLGSFVLSRLAGALIATSAAGGVACICLVVVFALEGFSIATSTAGFTSRLYDAAREENVRSPEYIAAQNTVILYEQQIRDLQSRARALPANYVTKGQEISREISALMPRLERAQRTAAEIDVSAVGVAMAAVEETLGVSDAQIALTAAVLLSATPFAVLLALGALSAQGRARRPAPSGDAPGKG